MLVIFLRNVALKLCKLRFFGIRRCPKRSGLVDSHFDICCGMLCWERSLGMKLTKFKINRIVKDYLSRNYRSAKYGANFRSVSADRFIVLQ